MKIKRLYAENLYSYEKLEFGFEKYPGGTTLLLGRNLDQKTSNGSGKSSIMKSLFFGIYGEDVNGANKASVLRRGSSGWYVVVEFEDRGHDYKIERFEGRKDLANSGKGLNFYIDNELFNGDGLEETQKFINQKIKITPRLFLSSIYAAQNAKSNFLLESDTNKKELLSELLDLQIYGKAFNFVKDEIDKYEKAIEDKENKIENINNQIKENESHIKDLIEKRDKFYIETKNEIKKELSYLDNLNQKIESLNKRVKNSEIDPSIVKNEIESIEKELESIDKELENEIKLFDIISKLNNSIHNFNKEISKNNSDINVLEKELVELDFSFDKSLLEKESREISEIEKEILLFESLKKKKNELDILLIKKANELESLKKEKEYLKNKIFELEKSEKCPTCLRDFDDTHIEHINNQISLIKESIEKVELPIFNIDEDILKIKSLIEEKEFLFSKEEEVKELLKKKNNNLIELNILYEKFKTNEQEKNKKEQKIKELKLETEQKEKDLSSFDLKLKEANIVSSQFSPLKERKQNLLTDLKKKREDLFNIEKEKSLIEEIKKNLKDLNESKKEVENKIKVLKNKSNPYSEMILTLDKRSTEFLENIEKIKKLILKEREFLKYYNFWKIGFAPTGIRSFITDDVIDLLNKKVQDNLNDLFDGAISVLFDPESKNKKGIISNKISTNFFLNGKETAKESLSGGELRRAILATELALTEIAESRSGNKLNIRFLDEPFDGIDSNGQMQAFRLFSRLSKDKDGFFVISHDENFQNLCSNVIYILKKNEISRIVEKSVYDKSDIFSDVSDLEDNDVVESNTQDLSSNKDKSEILAEKLKKLAAAKKKEE